MKTFLCASTSLLVVLATTWPLCPVAAQEMLTYPDLAGRMTDLAHLAVLPQPGEKCSQWSSYDRASKYDEKTRKYVNWDANGDGGGIIRQEGDLVVMAEMEGPGCIWRIWSAAPEKGHVKIYLDGRERAGRGHAVRRLLRRQARPIQLTRGSPTISHGRAAAARTCTCRSPIRNRARSWPRKAGATITISHTTRFPRAPRFPRSAPPWSPRMPAP